MGRCATARLGRALPTVSRQSAQRSSLRLRRRRSVALLSPVARCAVCIERMFERRDLPTNRSTVVSLLVDGSASMLQPRPLPQRPQGPMGVGCRHAGAVTIARLCDELQIDFEVALFNRAFAAAADDTEETFSERRHRATEPSAAARVAQLNGSTRTVNHYLVKPFDTRWRVAEDSAGGPVLDGGRAAGGRRGGPPRPEAAPPISMFDKAANVDEFNVPMPPCGSRTATSSTRILVVLAGRHDARFGAGPGRLGRSRRAIRGAVVLGIGIGDQTVQAAYSRNQVVEIPEELAAAMVDGVRSARYQTIADHGRGHLVGPLN